MQLYLMETTEFLAEDMFQRGCALVDRVRLQKINTCKQTKDKVRSLCCGLLLQYAVREHQSGECAVSGQKGPLPIELKYKMGAYGKPAFADMPGLHFNLSHSGDWAVLAVSDREVGVDIQENRPVKVGMVKKVLSPAEYEKYLLLSADPLAKEEWFLRCWCAKESYGKLTGKGIRQGMDTLIFREESGKIQDIVNQKEVPCKEYVPVTGYRMNVCCERDVFPEQVTKISFSHILGERQ